MDERLQLTHQQRDGASFSVINLGKEMMETSPVTIHISPSARDAEKQRKSHYILLRMSLEERRKCRERMSRNYISLFFTLELHKNNLQYFFPKKEGGSFCQNLWYLAIIRHQSFDPNRAERWVPVPTHQSRNTTILKSQGQPTGHLVSLKGAHIFNTQSF